MASMGDCFCNLQLGIWPSLAVECVVAKYPISMRFRMYCYRLDLRRPRTNDETPKTWRFMRAMRAMNLNALSGILGG